MRPHLPNKTRLPPKRRGKWRGWVTHARIDENPVKRGTRSLPRQDVPRKLPRKRTWLQCDDALRDTSADLIGVNIILSMAVCGNLFCRAGHCSWCLQSSMKDLEEEPALQCRRQSARRTRRH